MFVSCMLRLFNAYHLVDDVVIFTLIIQIRTIMVDNIEKVLERGDRIELLVDKTATMQDSSFHFRKQSKRLRRALWMKNFKLL
jgi:vesicle-associated membrane protein 7